MSRPVSAAVLLALFCWPAGAAAAEASRPNILLYVADDWGWPHTGADGSGWLATPGFDRVAREGVRFRNAIANCPSCTPARGCLLTGRYPWMLEEGATLWGALPRDYAVFPDVLEAAGYRVGFTGKGWGPGRRDVTGWPRNPAGPAFNIRSAPRPASGMSATDYAANFEQFLAARQAGQPFFFWCGPNEPHRGYEPNSGVSKGGLDPALVDVPSFWPDCPEIRGDLLDYALEVQHGDAHLERILAKLAEIGELDDTLVIVTGDHGMPFPRCKANLYEYGIHVPLAVRWGNRVPDGRVVEDLVSFIDFAPTILAAAGCAPPAGMRMHGRNFLEVLVSDGEGVVDGTRSEVVIGLERHGIRNGERAGYPGRGLRTTQYLYIRNHEPDRSPYVSDWGPTAAQISPLRDSADPQERRFWQWNFGTRPAEELYDIVRDPECLDNLASSPAAADPLAHLRARCEAILREHRDPRVLGYGEIFLATPFYSNAYPQFHQPGQAHLDAALARLAGDDNRNRTSNLVEIALAGDLLPARDRLWSVEARDGVAVCSYNRPAERFSMRETVSWSLDLVNWSSQGVTLEMVADHGSYERVEARLAVPPGAASVYFRIEVEFDASNLD